MPLPPATVPGFFVTATDTDVGKTVIAGAVADWFRRRKARVGVLKPVATGCPHLREGLVSEDAEFLAACADTPHPLDVVCPNRYAEPLAPSVAAERAGVPVDWSAVERSLRVMAATSDVLIVEGAGGVMVPVDAKITMLDVARALELPAIVVARPGLGTVNHTVLTVNALRAAGVAVAGVVVNRYPAESPGVAEETNPRQIEKWAKAPVLAIVPDEPVAGVTLPPGIVSAVGQVDWSSLASRRA